MSKSIICETSSSVLQLLCGCVVVWCGVFVVCFVVCGCVVWCVCRVLCGVVWLWGSPKSQQNILGLLTQEIILVLCSRVLVAQYLVTLDKMPTKIFSCRDFRAEICNPECVT